MKNLTQFLFMLLCICLPATAFADANKDKDDDSKYLAGAVPEVDGKVVFIDNLEVWSGQVNRTIEKLHRQQKQENSSRIFVAGSPIIFPNLKLLQLIEQAGMSITADDICSSERIMPGGIIYNDTSEYGMLRAIAERYHKACVCPTFADNSRRVNNIISTAKEYNIKGVIFNLLKGCHPYDIEAITIERKLKEHGLKFIKIETDYGKEDSQNILTRLEAFKQTL